MNRLRVSLILPLVFIALQFSWAESTKEAEEEDMPALSGQETKALKDADTVMREQMLSWSRQLGVTCVYCHNTKNFKSEEKSNFKTAREHSRMLKMLNELYFADLDSTGKQRSEATCFVCHRGQGKALWKQPANNLTH